jgi:uncharacterized protein YukE
MKVSSWIIEGALPPFVRLLFPKFAKVFAEEAEQLYSEIERLEEKIKVLEEQLRTERQKFKDEQSTWQKRHSDQYDLIVNLRTALRALLGED